MLNIFSKNRPIKLHWSSSKTNFGDCLSPLICERLSGKKVTHTSPRKAELVAIGSLLHRFSHTAKGRATQVWGTGFIEAGEPTVSQHQYFAVRGKLTKERIIGLDDCVLGDPGLLAFMLLEKRPEKRWQTGIIPHYEDQDHHEVLRLKEQNPNIRVIDILKPVPEVLTEIASCDVILSSAMHGLIAADSLGVPNAWINLSDKVRGNGYKFNDYYSAFGFEEAPSFALTDQLLADGLEDIINSYHRPNIKDIQSNLYNCFPYLNKQI